MAWDTGIAVDLPALSCVLSVGGDCIKGWAARRLARLSAASYLPVALAACSVNLQHLQEKMACLRFPCQHHLLHSDLLRYDPHGVNVVMAYG